jgi:hypothetical protein
MKGKLLIAAYGIFFVIIIGISRNSKAQGTTGSAIRQDLNSTVQTPQAETTIPITKKPTVKTPTPSPTKKPQSTNSQIIPKIESESPKREETQTPPASSDLGTTKENKGQLDIPKLVPVPLDSIEKPEGDSEQKTGRSSPSDNSHNVDVGDGNSKAKLDDEDGKLGEDSKADSGTEEDKDEDKKQDSKGKKHAEIPERANFKTPFDIR